MKIKIRDIVSAGFEYQDQAMPKDLDINDDFVDLDSPVIVRGKLNRVDNFVLASLEVVYTADTVCARCLDNINKEIFFKCDLEFEFNPGDEYIDVGQGVREEILLGCKLRDLCREDCKGICPGCGVYLNEEKCECK